MGDGLELRMDANDNIHEVWATRAGRRTQQWVRPPDFCTSGTTGTLRAEFDFERDDSNTELARYTIRFGHREASLQLRLVPEAGGVMIRVEMDDSFQPQDAETVLKEWFPDEVVTGYFRPR